MPRRDPERADTRARLRVCRVCCSALSTSCLRLFSHVRAASAGRINPFFPSLSHSLRAYLRVFAKSSCRQRSARTRRVETRERGRGRERESSRSGARKVHTPASALPSRFCAAVAAVFASLLLCRIDGPLFCFVFPHAFGGRTISSELGVGEGTINGERPFTVTDTRTRARTNGADGAGNAISDSIRRGHKVSPSLLLFLFWLRAASSHTPVAFPSRQSPRRRPAALATAHLSRYCVTLPSPPPLPPPSPLFTLSVCTRRCLARGPRVGCILFSLPVCYHVERAAMVLRCCAVDPPQHQCDAC